MQLSNSTVSTDPSLLATLFPGVTPANDGAAPSLTSPERAAEFGALFADLAPVAATSEEAGDGAAEMAPALIDFATPIAPVMSPFHRSSVQASGLSADSSTPTKEAQPPVESDLSAPGENDDAPTGTDAKTENTSRHRSRERQGPKSTRSGQRVASEEGRAASRNENSVTADSLLLSAPPAVRLDRPRSSDEDATEVAPSSGVEPRWSRIVVGERTPLGMGRPTSVREFATPRPIFVHQHQDDVSPQPGTPKEATSASVPMREQAFDGPTFADTPTNRAATWAGEAHLSEREPGSSTGDEALSGAIEQNENRDGVWRGRAGIRWETGLLPKPTANFAASEQKILPPDLIAEAGRQKSFVTASEEELTSERKELGISVAKPTPPMFTRSLPAPPPHPASEYAAAGIAATTGVGEVQLAASTGEFGTLEVNRAHEAVEAVLQAVEHVASREQTAVQLKFAVGDTELSVSVELHANEVRATFRTDSPELRAALNSEWQTATAALGGDRTLRVVPAILNTSETAAFNTSAGDTSSGRREPGTRRDGSEHVSDVGARARGPVAPVGAVDASRGAGPARSVSHRSHRLHTIA